jgi:hypothetical protein
MEDFRVKKLAEIYMRGTKEATIVADICDSVLDRSGGLLGEVRDAVQHITEADAFHYPLKDKHGKEVNICYCGKTWPHGAA